MTRRHRQRIEAGREALGIGIDEMHRSRLGETALAEPRREPPKKTIRMPAMRIEHAHTAAVENILPRHVLDEVGLAAAGGADDVHVLKPRPLIKPHRPIGFVAAENDETVVR
jgi:hypothetical protein